MPTDPNSLPFSRLRAQGRPVIEFLTRIEQPGQRVGVFASSFNPVTVAHVELIRTAVTTLNLNEAIALAGLANADKTHYELSLEDRVEMLKLAFAGDPSTSIAVSSHPYFTDMLDALLPLFPAPPELHFILGFDTFERVLDRDSRYYENYHRRFPDRVAAIEYLLRHSRLAVAGRSGAGEAELRKLLQQEVPALTDRVLFLDVPVDLAERSASEVRERCARGLSITGLVPDAVREYVSRRRLLASIPSENH